MGDRMQQIRGQMTQADAYADSAVGYLDALDAQELPTTPEEAFSQQQQLGLAMTWATLAVFEELKSTRSSTTQP